MLVTLMVMMMIMMMSVILLLMINDDNSSDDDYVKNTDTVEHRTIFNKTKRTWRKRGLVLNMDQRKTIFHCMKDRPVQSRTIFDKMKHRYNGAYGDLRLEKVETYKQWSTEPPFTASSDQIKHRHVAA